MPDTDAIIAANPDTWLARALQRRTEEDNGTRTTTGARFNSYI